MPLYCSYALCAFLTKLENLPTLIADNGGDRSNSWWSQGGQRPGQEGSPEGSICMTQECVRTGKLRSIYQVFTFNFRPGFLALVSACHFWGQHGGSMGHEKKEKENLFTNRHNGYCDTSFKELLGERYVLYLQLNLNSVKRKSVGLLLIFLI